MKTIKYILKAWIWSVIFIGTVAYAADPAQYGTPFSGVPDPRDASIYQVNMRCFSSTRNLQGVINRLDNIKALGVNVIYIMPVQPVSTSSKAVNSPYSWKDFVSVGSEFGTLTTLRALVDGAHSRGMAVIMDWVANQTGWDHPWITAHPDWYVQSGGVIQSLNGWADVAALNMTNTTMRTEMINSMRYWIFAANIDGFRCDYANNNVAFWGPVISNLRGITTHKLLMFAEGDASGLYGAGFDYLFSWTFYGDLKSIKGGSAVTLIDNANTSDYSGSSGTKQIVRWLSNHDIYGSEGSPYTVLGGKAAVLADFVVSAYMKSVPFIYNGMEVGNTVAMAFPFNTSVINWSQDVSITPLMTQIIAFRNSSIAIRQGTLTSYDNADVCAFKKVSGTQTVFVLANLRNASKTFTLPSGIASTTMIDAFSNASVSLGTSITLSAYQYRVFKNGTVSNVAVTGVTMSPTTATIAVSSTQQLTATVAPTNATNKNVTWSSSNTAIASVSTSGLVTGIASGSATITVTTADQAKTATCAITVSGTAAITYYQIQNRWKTTYYLYDGGNGQVKYSTTAPSTTNALYQWQQISVTGGYIQLKNRSTGNYMHIQDLNGSVECGAITQSWTSAQWSLVSAATGWYYLKNVGQTADWIHIEGLLGYAQYTGPQTGWYSAMWAFVNGTTKSADEEPTVQNSTEISYMPNPVINELRIEFNGNSFKNLVLFDLSGKIMYTEVIDAEASNFSLNLSDFNTGMYFLRLSNESNTQCIKIIKK
jgi:uncharacterized protein YjdB